MSLIGRLFSKAGGGLLDSIGGIIDSLHTSTEEKAKIKLELQKMILAHDTTLQESLQVELRTKEAIIVAEMSQGDNFTKRARPAVVYTFVLTILIAVIRSAITGEPPTILQQIPSELWKLWTAVMGVWMVGRTFEKRGTSAKILASEGASRMKSLFD